jgi:cytochrome P450
MANTHLAFGKGVHYYVDARLAPLEGHIVVRELVARTSSIELDPDRRPHVIQSLLVRRLATLPLRITSAP